MANGELWRIDNMFQLSVELYDTKGKKVVWSDRWQEKWDNLPSIKSHLSEGILKSLNKDLKFENQIDTTNSEAYEFYLKGKYKFNTRKDDGDIKVARGLLKKAIELDNNLFSAKNLLAWSYLWYNELEIATEIYKESLLLSERVNDKSAMSDALNGMSRIYDDQKEYEKAIVASNKCLKIKKILDDKRGIAGSLCNLAITNIRIGKKDKAYDYFNKALNIFKKINDEEGQAKILANLGVFYTGDLNTGDKAVRYLKLSLDLFEKLGMLHEKSNGLFNISRYYFLSYEMDFAIENCFKSIEVVNEFNDDLSLAERYEFLGDIYLFIGEFELSETYYHKSLECFKKINDNHRISEVYLNLGILLIQNEKIENALKYLDNSIQYYSEKDFNFILEREIYLNLIYSKNDRKVNYKKIEKLMQNREDLGFYLNFHIYKLLNNNIYLETANKQVQEKADNLEPDIRKLFLSYPIPKAIVEEWEKLKL
jgi:tetratricopeptide (TPR) repeat protein